VLTYHGLAAENNPSISARERKYWMTPARFLEQMSLLSREGFERLNLGSFWDNGSKQPVCPTIVTFDDGLASDYESAFPVLLETRTPATFFVNTSTIGTLGHLTWSQLAEMHRAGMSIESHSHEHAFLSELPPAELRRQLELSKRTIEDRLGAPVRFVAAPYGDTSKAVLSEAIALGYSALCTSHNRPARAGSSLVNRVVVYGSTSDREFRRLVSRDAWFYFGRAVRENLLYLPKEIVGLSRKLRRPVGREVSA
jgi:peptidoglycan/xylan/chitin deacetylase (PgdA/CDA1 family)